MSLHPVSALAPEPAARRPLAAPRTSRPARWVAALCCAAAPSAWAIDPAVSLSSTTIEVRSDLVPAADTRAAQGSNTAAPSQPAMLSGAVRNSVWARSGAAAIGVGIETPMGTVADPRSAGATGERANLVAPNLLLGVALHTGPRSSLVLDTPLVHRNAAIDSSLNPAAAGREVRVGLVIKPADPLRNLRAGQLFKLELSGRAQLALKPRSGGVALSYSNRF